MKNKYGVLNPDQIVKSNIEKWRGQGHSDWHIGTAMMKPRLKTEEQFASWGLQWSPPDGSAFAPPTPKRELNRQDMLARLHEALDRAIAGDKSVSRAQICRIAHIGNSTFQKLCVEYPDTHKKWAQLSALNRSRVGNKGKRFIQIGQARRRKLDDAAKVIDQAIAEMRPITMEELSLAVGQYSSWFQQLCRDRCHPAIALRKRMDAHNVNARYAQKRSA